MVCKCLILHLNAAIHNAIPALEPSDKWHFRRGYRLSIRASVVSTPSSRSPCRPHSDNISPHICNEIVFAGVIRVASADKRVDHLSGRPHSPFTTASQSPLGSASSQKVEIAQEYKGVEHSVHASLALFDLSELWKPSPSKPNPQQASL